MIGVNDQQDEVFDQAAAAQVVSFAQQQNLGELAFWSANRDQAGGSGITQTDYQFTDIFETFELPTLAVNDVSVTEGTSGTMPAIFTVTLSAASTQSVTVQYATVDGTATAGVNYTAAIGTLSFAPGVTQQFVTVSIINNASLPSGEQFSLQLSNAAGASVGAAGTCTIVNPNAPVQISAGNVQVTENASGLVPVVFPVSLSRPLNKGETVSVQYATVDGTAKAGINYAATQGTLTFTAGQSQATVSVSVIGGLLPGSTEQFSLLLSDPSEATLAVSSGAGVMVDNDPAISVAVTYQTTDDWGSGFGGEIDLQNTGTQTINSWQLAFDFPYNITSIWNTNPSYTHTGNHYVISNPTWEGGGTIGPGQTVSVGFNGSPGNVTAGPANYVFNGVPLGPPTALVAAAGDWTSAGLTLTLANDGELHLYRTGTTTDAVTPLLAAMVSSVQITGPASSTGQLTLDFSAGNPIPGGGVAFTGGQAGRLLIEGTSPSQSATVANGQITVGSSTITFQNVGYVGLDLGAEGVSNLAGSSGLAKSGPGTLVLSGTNAYAGGTLVQGGTLIATGANALPAGTSLSVGAGSTFVFGSLSPIGFSSAAVIAGRASGLASADVNSTTASAVSGLPVSTPGTRPARKPTSDANAPGGAAGDFALSQQDTITFPSTNAVASSTGISVVQSTHSSTAMQSSMADTQTHQGPLASILVSSWQMQAVLTGLRRFASKENLVPSAYVKASQSIFASSSAGAIVCDGELLQTLIDQVPTGRHNTNLAAWDDALAKY